MRNDPIADCGMRIGDCGNVLIADFGLRNIRMKHHEETEMKSEIGSLQSAFVNPQSQMEWV